MQSAHGDLTRQRKLQAMALSSEARGGRFNLGKKVSVPVDIQQEELNLPSNRGSRMFQQRMRRAEMFTLENEAHAPRSYPVVHHVQVPYHPQVGKENVRTGVIGQPRKMLVTTLDKTLAKKGTPDVIAPGYSGPLKEMPPEKFNVTVTPKGYCSPWREALGETGGQQFAVTLPDPPYKQYVTQFRCFNRAPIPFTRVVESPRYLPAPKIEIETEPAQPQFLPARRTNFNCAPRGWGTNYTPESNEL